MQISCGSWNATITIVCVLVLSLSLSFFLVCVERIENLEGAKTYYPQISSLTITRHPNSLTFIDSIIEKKAHKWVQLQKLSPKAKTSWLEHDNGGSLSFLPCHSKTLQMASLFIVKLHGNNLFLLWVTSILIWNRA